MDHYLKASKSIQRLKDEYNKYGKIVIAYRVENVLYDIEDGVPYHQVIKLLKRFREYAYFIAFSEDDGIKDTLDLNDIPYDAINSGLDYLQELPKSKSPIPYYTVLLDYRSGLSQVYEELMHLLSWVKFRDMHIKMDKAKSILIGRYPGLNITWDVSYNIYIDIRPVCLLKLKYEQNELDRFIHEAYFNVLNDEEVAEYIDMSYIQRWDIMKHIKPRTSNKIAFIETWNKINNMVG